MGMDEIEGLKHLYRRVERAEKELAVLKTQNDSMHKNLDEKLERQTKMTDGVWDTLDKVKASYLLTASFWKILGVILGFQSIIYTLISLSAKSAP